jgi:hypothetical protein
MDNLQAQLESTSSKGGSLAQPADASRPRMPVALPFPSSPSGAKPGLLSSIFGSKASDKPAPLQATLVDQAADKPTLQATLIEKGESAQLPSKSEKGLESSLPSSAQTSSSLSSSIPTSSSFGWHDDLERIAEDEEPGQAKEVKEGKEGKEGVKAIELDGMYKVAHAVEDRHIGGTPQTVVVGRFRPLDSSREFVSWIATGTSEAVASWSNSVFRRSLQPSEKEEENIELKIAAPKGPEDADYLSTRILESMLLSLLDPAINGIYSEDLQHMYMSGRHLLHRDHKNHPNTPTPASEEIVVPIQPLSAGPGSASELPQPQAAAADVPPRAPSIGASQRKFFPGQSHVGHRGREFVEPVWKRKERFMKKYKNEVDALSAAQKEQITWGKRVQKTVIGILPFVGPTSSLVWPLFLQIREVATVASFRGYDLSDEGVRTKILLCIVAQEMGGLPGTAVKKAARLVAKKLLFKSGAKLASRTISMWLPVGAIYDFLTLNYEDVIGRAKLAFPIQHPSSPSRQSQSSQAQEEQHSGRLGKRDTLRQLLFKDSDTSEKITSRSYL